MVRANPIAWPRVQTQLADNSPSTLNRLCQRHYTLCLGSSSNSKWFVCFECLKNGSFIHYDLFLVIIGTILNFKLWIRYQNNYIEILVLKIPYSVPNFQNYMYNEWFSNGCKLWGFGGRKTESLDVLTWSWYLILYWGGLLL